MAWLGVPFTTAGAWNSFEWTAPAFLQQFLDQSVARNAAYAALYGGGATAWPSAINLSVVNGQSIGIGNATFNLRDVRRFSGAGPSTVDDASFEGFAIPPSVGQKPGETATILGNRITQAFLDRINTFLDDAGCPPMGTAPLAADAATKGIPWTRQSGNPASPTTSYGQPQEGDIIGPHFFNEWWALLNCLDTLLYPPTIPPATYDLEQKYGFAEGAPAEAAADVLARAETDFDAYTPGAVFPAGLPIREQVNQSASYNLDGDATFTLWRYRGGLTLSGLNAPGVQAGAKVAHVAHTYGTYEAWGDALSGLGKIAYVDTLSAWSPTAGSIVTPPRVPLTPAPATTVFSAAPGATVNAGYWLNPLVYLTLSIPPP